MARIAIDYTPAYEQGGGIGRYVRDLICALAQLDEENDYRLFVAGASSSRLPSNPAQNFRWRPTWISPAWLARVWHRAQIPLPVEVFVGKVDLFHATDFVLPPTLAGTSTLLTVHDLSFMRVPEAASPRLKAYLNKVVPRSVKRAQHVLADSKATKDDLVALYGVPGEKVTVLLSGVDSRFQESRTPALIDRVRQKYRLGIRPYILSVGTVQPRKNYSRLIEALARLRAQGRDVGLVIAGGHGWLEDPIYETIRRTQMENFVHLIGFADDVDLPILYSGAACLAFPSMYEGFGLPILEAMACGTPVLTSKVSSLPEVAGDAALLVDPYDLEEMTEALGRLLEDEALRQSFVEKGRERVKLFTWERAARQLREIYATMLGE